MWVERSETRRDRLNNRWPGHLKMMGIASLHPSYRLAFDNAVSDQGFLTSPAGVMKIIRFAMMMVPARK
jgi:hypothetical protein